MKSKTLIISFILALASIVAFNSLFYRTPLFESGIYYGFLQSWLQDHDLNLINNIDPKISWILSPTFNVPVMHDHGSILAWAPLGYFANKLDQLGVFSIVSTRGSETLLLYSVMLSSLIFIALGMRILKSVVKPESSVEKFLFWSFPLTSPLLFYGFFEFVSADVVIFFWACVVLYFGQNLKFENPSESLLWGILLGLGRAIKISSLFWIPYFLFEIFYKRERSSPAKRFLLFVSGFMIPIALKWINDYREFGFLTWNNGYGYDFEFPRPAIFTSLYQNLFGNFGLVFIGFWLVVGFCFFLLNQASPVRDRKKIVWLVLAVVVMAKFGYECLLVSDNETEFGFRRYVIDLPFMIWMVVEFWKTPWAQSKNVRLFAFLLLATNFIWAGYYLFWYLDVDQHYYGALGVYRYWEFGAPGRQFLQWLHELGRAFQMPGQYLLAFGVFAFSLTAQFLARKFWKPKWGQPLIATVATLYFVITLVNFFQNPRNVEALKSQGQLQSQVISNNLSTLLYDEILSEIGRNILISKYVGDRPRFDQSVEMLRNYISKIPATLIRDPIQFGDSLRMGRLRKIYYDAELDMEGLTDFQVPSYYDKTMGPYKGSSR